MIRAVALSLGLAGWIGAAQASPDVQMGLSVPVTRVRLLDPLGSGKPVLEGLAAGAGYQLELGWLPTLIGSASWDMIGLGLTAFATFPQTGPQVALAAQVCTLEGLACLGFGSDLLASYDGDLSGLMAGRVSRRNLFTLLTFNVGLATGSDIHSDGNLKANRYSLTLGSPPAL